jgi:hypothetical protein
MNNQSVRAILAAKTLGVEARFSGNGGATPVEPRQIRAVVQAHLFPSKGLGHVASPAQVPPA